jgi:hypothetical protein
LDGGLPSGKVIIMNGRATRDYQPPTVLAMVLCEHVAAAAGPGTRTIQGTFSGIEVAQFPTRIPDMAVYVALSDGRGAVPITVTVAGVDGDPQPGLSATATVDFADPTSVRELTYRFCDLVVTGPGDYRIELTCGGEPLMARRLYVRSAGGG